MTHPQKQHGVLRLSSGLGANVAATTRLVEHDFLAPCRCETLNPNSSLGSGQEAGIFNLLR